MNANTTSHTHTHSSWALGRSGLILSCPILSAELPDGPVGGGRGPAVGLLGLLERLLPDLWGRSLLLAQKVPELQVRKQT